MNSKKWLIYWSVLVATAFIIICVLIYHVDPLFHYHKPLSQKFFYTINSQREQNDGISKHFDYDGIITGTSMTEYFKPSEAEKLFGGQFIKVPYSGATYKEINDNLIRAIDANPNIKIVIRSLDMTHIIMDANAMRTDLGTFPYYLYDKNPFNDVEYLLNRDVLESTISMIDETRSDAFAPGITSFEYSLSNLWAHGKNAVIPTPKTFSLISPNNPEDTHLSFEEKQIIYKNITQNVTDLADKNPDIDFYYFYPPYSVLYWYTHYEENDFHKQFEALQYATELIVPHTNIHLFSFNERIDITSDLNNYRDNNHYGNWINSLILKWMKDDQYRLTDKNYSTRLKHEYEIISSFDYPILNNQPDYEYDFFAGALLNEELTGFPSVEISRYKASLYSPNNPITTAPDNQNIRIICSVTKIPDDIDSVGAFLYNHQNNITLINMTKEECYNYLVFKGKKKCGVGIPAIYIYDKDGNILTQIRENDFNYDDSVHTYTIDLRDISGVISILFSFIADCNNANEPSEFTYYDIFLY
ncbi:hypothetical protein [Butyrivibrio sp. YAB3001]|uniref:hypothetical protein n=1 Tax=Butyrivibrio sp. YAB3001 TaxID=1520812 RepID=UPI0008F68D7C|nr:hypothetical protein [Butyrivibrio sp. YAB3001]SFC74809.1 hypothetical protein SAMN02910398_03057 [Butyrivibrio sp. YAB3001]